ncbi:MAG: thiol peroxidase [Spirochaetales bacterium]|nr:thiol peroxidase [Spirochaetales bacterium]
MGGNIITLVGNTPNLGDPAPDFTVRNNDLFQVSLSDFDGKIKLISVIPSIDTSICDLQSKKFNDEAVKISDRIVLLSLSMDLPFALSRWAKACKAKNIITLSDYIDASFGINYGVLIKELRLLNRSVFILDESNHINYIEIVDENHNHPNYDKAFDALKKLF